MSAGIVSGKVACVFCKQGERDGARYSVSVVCVCGATDWLVGLLTSMFVRMAWRLSGRSPRLLLQRGFAFGPPVMRRDAIHTTQNTHKLRIDMSLHFDAVNLAYVLGL